MGCNGMNVDARRNGHSIGTIASHAVARLFSQLHLKPLLTGWSLIRIRPGEPNFRYVTSLNPTTAK
jgi:hypothetical protein